MEYTAHEPLIQLRRLERGEVEQKIQGKEQRVEKVKILKKRKIDVKQNEKQFETDMINIRTGKEFDAHEFSEEMYHLNSYNNLTRLKSRDNLKSKDSLKTKSSKHPIVIEGLAASSEKNFNFEQRVQSLAKSNSPENIISPFIDSQKILSEASGSANQTGRV